MRLGIRRKSAPPPFTLTRWYQHHRLCSFFKTTPAQVSINSYGFVAILSLYGRKMRMMTFFNLEICFDQKARQIAAMTLRDSHTLHFITFSLENQHITTFMRVFHGQSEVRKIRFFCKLKLIENAHISHTTSHNTTYSYVVIHHSSTQLIFSPALSATEWLFSSPNPQWLIWGHRWYPLTPYVPHKFHQFNFIFNVNGLSHDVVLEGLR